MTVTTANTSHGLGALRGFLVSRLRGRPDGEHEMVLNRLVISLLILLYLLGTAVFGSYSISTLYTPLSVATFYFVMSVAFFVHILARPGISPVRRTLAIVLDMGTLSVGLHIGDEVVAVLYPFYLWIIFGNGFRFGIRYLFVATVAAVIGFAVTITTTDYWGAHSHLSFGLLGALIALPLYSSTLIRKLSKAKQQAEEASRAKSLFLASVSHELRTPLNAIIGLGDLLRDTSLDAEQRDMTRTIRTSAKSLLGLIDDILDLSRIEAGRISSNVVDFDLHRTVSEVKGMLTAQARAKGVRLAVHVTPQVPYLLRGEMRHLQEVLINLVGNAVKFTGRGHIVIAVDLVEQNAGHARLRFEVSDSGIGIAPEACGRIFESFTQADETITSRYGGTGLGLAICKQLVEHQGGQIGVDSEVGTGSTFWFELPFTRAGGATTEACDAPVVLLASGQDRTEATLNALFRVGVGAKIARTLADAVEMVRANNTPGARRPIVIVDEEAVEDPAAAAAKLAALDPAYAPSLLLLPREPQRGLLASPLRNWFVAVLSQPFAEAETLAALRLAGLRDAEEKDEAALPIRPKPGRKYAILVADDNRTNQKVIAKILERAGHEPTIVDNGERALDALTQHDFDLVLMDVNMPVMNGIEAVKLYRFSALGKKRVPVVALTADATPEMSTRCTEAGMDACVTKPVEPARLLQIVDAMVEASAPATAAPAESDTVKLLSSHRKFQAAGLAPVDFAKLTDLEALGGSGFVGQLIEEFLVDAEAVLREMAAAVAANDVEAFRDRAHALRSGAANIGAGNIYKICLAWRNIGERELASDGEAHMRKLQTEFEQVHAALSRRLEEGRAEPSRQGA